MVIDEVITGIAGTDIIQLTLSIQVPILYYILIIYCIRDSYVRTESTMGGVNVKQVLTFSNISEAVTATLAPITPERHKAVTGARYFTGLS